MGIATQIRETVARVAHPQPESYTARAGVPVPAGHGTPALDRLADMVSLHSPDGTYRWVSAAVRELLGYEPAELEGAWAYDLIHPDDHAKVSAAHQNALAQAPFAVAYRLRRRAGDYVRVETTTRVLTDEDGRVAEIACCTRSTAGREAWDAGAGEDRRSCLERVGRVLAEGAVQPVFQPMVELETGRVIAYESLARFPGDRAHGPDRWFEDAWRVGLGLPLELLCARRAAEALHRLPANVTLCINASPPTIAAEGFAAAVGGQLKRICVETTEHLRVDDYGELGRKLGAFRAAGGGLMIDDFGAGFASLQHVLELRPDWIKLDISLTERLLRDDLARALVASVVSFAREVEIGVIAEGIETRAELEALRGLGVRFGQGFYIAHPAALAETLC